MKWHIEHEYVTSTYEMFMMNEYFVEWWNVTNNEKFFRCRSEDDAEWLLEILNSQEDKRCKNCKYWNTNNAYTITDNDPLRENYGDCNNPKMNLVAGICVDEDFGCIHFEYKEE